ncbi:MAG: hypothetical protein K9W44_13315 [Candidatus Lokiarchaeota archaeon]|nr:hypothetical protein [Candidatus Harpocratesius repetitus]
MNEISSIPVGSSHQYLEINVPGRICLLGDKIDLANLPVIGCAIDCLATIKIRKLSQPVVRIFSKTFQRGLEYNLGEKGDWEHPLKYWCAIIYRLWKKIDGFEAILTSNIPVGAGVSSSAAISVGLIQALNSLFQLKMSTLEIAELAYRTEHDDLGIMCGRLDQYSIAFGGVSFINTGETPSVEKIPISTLPIILADSGDSRQAQVVLQRIKTQLKQDDPLVLNCFQKIHLGVKECRTALIEGDFERIGKLMNLQQEQERLMKTTTSKLDKMCEAALRAGALGAKQIGAGGGGSMIALCPLHTEDVIQALKKVGATVRKFDIFNY